MLDNPKNLAKHEDISIFVNYEKPPFAKDDFEVPFLDFLKNSERSLYLREEMKEAGFDITELQGLDPDKLSYQVHYQFQDSRILLSQSIFYQIDANKLLELRSQFEMKQNTVTGKQELLPTQIAMEFKEQNAKGTVATFFATHNPELWKNVNDPFLANIFGKEKLEKDDNLQKTSNGEYAMLPSSP